MTSIDVIFSRELLKRVMERVRKEVSSDTIKHSWVYLYRDGTAEFHINKCKEVPEGYYSYFHATSKTEAKVEGWKNFLNRHRFESRFTVSKGEF